MNDSSVICNGNETDFEGYQEVVVDEDDPAAVPAEGDDVHAVNVYAEDCVGIEGLLEGSPPSFFLVVLWL